MNEQLGMYSVGPPMAMEPKCSAMTLSKGSHENWYSILVGIEYMVYTHHAFGDPPPALCHGGYGEMVAEGVGERVGERKKRRGGRVRARGAFYMFTSQVPSRNGWPFSLPFFTSQGYWL
ncbi:hypothetical protein N7449_004904 [Penicillium cf. viridicatum]|uniref:Uncharacterized protein n=1 Tax=Penicillium cf. viridicatum TaxID=2972119 RepID=A0A9W9MKE1_9EURO|nr:hypothetical protein N7449_004904 [Penicillium cf. viridicatum]